MKSNTLIFLFITAISIILAVGCGSKDKEKNNIQNNSIQNSNLSLNMPLGRALELGYNITRVNAKITKNSFFDSTDLIILDNSASGTFMGLEPGIYTININMYQNDTVIATGSGTGNVIGGQTTTVNIIMNFTGNLTIITSWEYTTELVAYYPFKGNAKDESGKRNNGTVYGATLTTDRFGNANSAYNFTGLNDYIMIPSNFSLDIKEDITIAAWVKFNNLSNNSYSQILWHGDSESGHDPYSLYISANSVGFRKDMGDDNTQQITKNIENLDINSFHLLAGSYIKASRMMRIYIDGNMVIEKIIPDSPIIYNTSSMWTVIGAVDNGNSQFFKGIIDDIRIYNHALNNTEIQTLYTLTK